MNIVDKITAVVEAYPQWSRAERRNLAAVTEEILAHCRDGNGNQFIQWWCERNLSHLFSKGESR